MTSKKAMFGSGRWRLPAAVVAVLVGVGCEGGPAQIIEPTVLTSPYPAPKLWAVAPFRNESGFSLVDGTAFADHLTRRLQQVDGIRVVPVNRVLAALAAENLAAVNSREAALRVMQTLDADGLVVGTLTAWDPYLPPKVGAMCQLHSRHRYDGSQLGRGHFDPLTLRTAGVDDQKQAVVIRRGPTSATVAGHFDSANGTVRLKLQAYAAGHTPPDAPAGWRRYLLNMDLYSEFVSYELARGLLAAEWNRLTASAPPTNRR